MVVILVIGLILALISVLLSFYELMGFFNAVGQLNRYTSKHGAGAYFLYAFRFITLLPKLAPVALDAIVMVVCSSIGFNGGTLGAIIGLMVSAVASILVKYYRWYIAPRNKQAADDWRLAHTPAR